MSNITPAAPRALVSGGGTGGHVFPGLAVAAVLAGRGWRVAWVGRAGGMEERLVSARGIEFRALRARPVVGRSAPARLAALATVGRSALAARRLIRRLGASVVLGTGGFVSAPAVLGARLAGRPALLLEPNARAGAANRWLSRWAHGAALAHDGARPDFRCSAHLTGVPVRAEFFEQPEWPASEHPVRLLVLGGSQGALPLNLLLPPAFAQLSRRLPQLSILHQVGAHEAATRAVYERLDLGGIEVRLTPFVEDVAGAMGEAHLVISRAGAVTLAEICAAGRPALLFPLALAGAHQEENASALETAGGAEVLAGGAPEPSEVAAHLAALLGDRQRLRRMGAALRSLARPGAAERIADLMESAAGGRR